MPEDLSGLKKKISDTLSDAWAKPEVRRFKNMLEDVFTEEGKRAYSSCMEGHLPPGEVEKLCIYKCYQLRTNCSMVCLFLAAKAIGLGDKFIKTWKDVPKELKEALLGVETLWSKEDKALVKGALKGLDIPRLYRLCANGEYSVVTAELGLPFTPPNYRTCLSCVATAKDVGAILKGLWGE
jgi:hypothetical protein